MINKKLIRPRIMSDAFSRNMAMTKRFCKRCDGEFEADRKDKKELCESCQIITNNNRR